MQEEQPFYKITYGSSPLVATAIHDGHAVRDNISHLIALHELERLREEDPFTATWVSVTDTQVIGLNSRFELDLNRPPEKAIYRRPEDAWGLTVWKEELPDALAAESLARYEQFYAAVKELLDRVVAQHGSFVVYDLHTYNHKRDGADGAAAAPEENPEVNIGTGNVNRTLWAPVIDTFINSLQHFDFNGRGLDVRENIKFKGGHFMRWIHDTYPDKACVLSIEFKKFFMDEWTGEPDEDQLKAIRRALQQTVTPVLRAREQVSLSLR